MFSGDATTYMGLPQWNPGDHPDWLDDMNPAFRKIDESYGALNESATEAAKLVKELVPIVQESAEKISELDTREEADRAYLQNQVDALKQADITLKGLIDALELKSGDLADATKDLQKRMLEEEKTTEGFSSAAGNRVIDRIQSMQKSLDDTILDLAETSGELAEHVALAQRKFTEYDTKFVDLEGSTAELDNRVQALEDWSSPFAQRVDALEKEYGEVTTEVVDIHKRLDILTTAVTQNTNDIAALKVTVAQVGSDVNLLKTKVSNVESEVTNLDMRVENAEDALVEAEESIGKNAADILILSDRVTALEEGMVIDLSKFEMQKITYNDPDKILLYYRTVSADYSLSEIKKEVLEKTESGPNSLFATANAYIAALEELEENTAIRGTFIRIDPSFAVYDKENNNIVLCPVVLGHVSFVLSNGLTISAGQTWGVQGVILLDTPSQEFFLNKPNLLNAIKSTPTAYNVLNGKNGYTRHSTIVDGVLNCQYGSLSGTPGLVFDSGIYAHEEITGKSLCSRGLQYVHNMV